MVTLRAGLTNSWRRSRRGLWPKAVMSRLTDALDALVRDLRMFDEVVAIVLFGAYARGDYGRKSDVDLLLLVCPSLRQSIDDLRRAMVRAAVDVEAHSHLPMHLVPLVADASSPENLGPDLLHAIVSDGVVLFAEASALAALQPEGLAPWVVVRFTSKDVPASQAVHLSRRLHGRGGKGGILKPPALELGRGALLVPASQADSLRAALDETGANYDIIPIWRAV